MNDTVSENSCFCIRMGNLLCIPCNEPFGKINEKTFKDTVTKHTKSDKHQKKYLTTAELERCFSCLNSILTKEIRWETIKKCVTILLYC